jgi:hypothetical protein
MGIAAAARAAYRTPHYFEDLRNIRPLVLHSNAVWPILVMCAAAGLYTAIRIGTKNSADDPIMSLIASFLFFPVPLVPPMLAGFLAPRATWLAGAIASFIATTTVLVVFVVMGAKIDSAGGIVAAEASPNASAAAIAAESPSPGSSAAASVTLAPTGSISPSQAVSSAGSSQPAASPSGSTANTGSIPTTRDAVTAALLLLPESVAFGFLMGALSGWYKRFLALTSGPRRATTRSTKRPVKRRPPTRRT